MRLKVDECGQEVIEATNGELVEVLESALSLLLDEVHGDSANAFRPIADGKRHFNASAVIDRIIYNDPYTIVFWTDGTKTSVKAHSGDKYDRAVGLMMCWLKRDLGNSSAWLDMLRDVKAIDANGDALSGAVNVSFSRNGNAKESELPAAEVAKRKKSK